MAAQMDTYYGIAYIKNEANEPKTAVNVVHVLSTNASDLGSA